MVTTDRRDSGSITRYHNGPEGPAVVEQPMQGNPHDRMKSYNDAGYSYGESSERERRIAQRRVILEDGTLPHEIRERAHERMCELQRERDEE